MAGGFRVVGRTDRFKKDFARLDAQQQQAVLECIRDLALNPIPTVRRYHCVSNKRPKVYSLDVFPNHSYKMTIQIEGSDVTLRRVGTHKSIDGNP
ncbi:type II toxin-antitoxin system RelE family toxin [Variovorax sp. MHTC-1]|uniref:type II toxin-antitoxin system RelE family toxin n=1 Tax=Variovorax sp. MHTC-1 TaxID=2495593 RepID=UPI000F89C6F9|nr:hypothetical protein [Variovorax sp. MHTC-1]RST47327.1 hypothetical protein EJI01_28030 [Variovorax sp. MHTC-1]